MSEPRVHVEHSGERTIAEFEKADLDARAAAKAAGFRWAPSLTAWVLPRPWNELTRRQRVDQLVARLGEGVVAVDDQGPGVVRSAAEREADAREHALARAERLDERAAAAAAGSDAAAARARGMAEHIPFGQLILVGHHSEGRHRRDLARIEGHDRKSWDLHQQAEADQQAANTARRTAVGPSPLARQRRIERNQAELRKAERELAAVGERDRMPGYWDRLTAQVAQLTDAIAHDQAEVAASGIKVYTPADIAKGDAIKAHGRWHRVARVNKTTVSVETGYSWTDKVPLHQVTDVRKPEAAAV